MRAGKLRLSFSASRFAGPRGRRGSFGFMRTIRAPLYLAFALAAAMTVVGSLFALLANATIGATLNEIVFRSMPATVESIRLSEDTSDMVASVPRLMAAEDENERSRVAKKIAVQFNSLTARIGRLRALNVSHGDELEVGVPDDLGDHHPADEAGAPHHHTLCAVFRHIHLPVTGLNPVSP